MAKVRFLADLAHQVPALGREVQPDELVDVPDSVFAELVWPETQWAVVAVTPSMDEE